MRRPRHSLSRRPSRPAATGSTIAYSGKINTQANGLFALDYKNKEGKDARSLFTQFEAADARRFVPSWDEPDYKATWDLTGDRAGQPDGGQQHAGRRKQAGRCRAQGSALPDDADDVVLPAVLRQRRLRPRDQAGRRPRSRHRHAAAATATRPAPRSTPRRRSCPITTTISARPTRFPSSTTSPGPASRNSSARWKIGARSSPSNMRSSTIRRSPAKGSARTSSAPKRTRWRTSGSATSSPWRGGTICGSTRASPAGWRPRRPSISIRTGAPTSTASARAKARWAWTRFKSTHPIVQQVRTVEQANQAFDSITYSKGESVLTMLEGFAGADAWRAGIRDYIAKHAVPEHADRRSVGGDGAAGATGPRDDRTRLHHPAGHPADHGRPGSVQRRPDRHHHHPVAILGTTSASRSRPIRCAGTCRFARRAGGAVTQVVTNGPTAQLTAPGCGPLLLNAGQTGYYRTLYTAAAAAGACRAPSRGSAPVDQYRRDLRDQMALSLAGYQPMGGGLGFVGASADRRHQQLVVQPRSARGTAFTTTSTGTPARRRRSLPRHSRSTARVCSSSASRRGRASRRWTPCSARR